MPIKYYYRPSSVKKDKMFFVADSILIFSTDSSFDDNMNLKGIKFYYDGQYISSEPEGEFIGYCVSGGSANESRRNEYYDLRYERHSWMYRRTGKENGVG